MILIISWPVILLCVGVWAVFSAICAVLYGIQNSWDDEKVKWLKPFTVKQKWGLFGLLLAIFGGVGAFLYGWFYHNAFAGTFGFFGAITASVFAARFCSPLKWDWQSAAHPLGVISSLASLLLVTAFAWIFILIAIFRKSTWRLYVGIVTGIAVFIASAIGGLAIYENIERNNTLKKAENYIAAAEYEKALDIYQNLDATELYLQTQYDYGKWLLAQGEYFDAKEIFAELSQVNNYKDSGEQFLRVNYLWAKDYEEKGNLEAAANVYAQIPDYEDAAERYQDCCYVSGCKNAEELAGWADAVEWFQKAGSYKDAPQLAIYYQARILGQKNLMEAEALLLQLPRDFQDVDTMLTAIEMYRDWGGEYTLTKAEGKDPKNYTKAELVLVYHRLSFPADAHVKWKVIVSMGGREFSYYSDGEMPQKGVLRFESGSDYQDIFEITQKKMKYVKREPYGSYTDDKKESRYFFEK